MAKQTVLLIPLFVIAALLGCRTTCAAGPAAAHDAAQGAPQIPEHEKLTYEVRWLGFPVGTSTASIKGIKQINGRPAYELEITARTNDFCSRIYNVEDRYVSYMDVQELYTLRHEVYRRDGRYKKDAITDFDQERHKAHFKNLLNATEKVVDLPPRVQDIVSMAYYFRFLPVETGQRREFFVYNNESVYELLCVVDEKVSVRVPRFGIREACHVQPYARLKGEAVKKGRANGFLGCDKKRLPLIGIVQGPIFTRVIAYLVREERPS